MAISGSGGCCTCEQFAASGCACGGGGSNCSLSCRAKGGIATICGFEPFEESSPPKRYRLRKKTGLEVIQSYQDAVNCDVFQRSLSWTYDSSCQIDALTCVLSQVDNSNLVDSAGVISGPFSVGCGEDVGTPDNATFAHSEFGDGSCIPFGGFDGFAYHAIIKTGGTETELSVEDTENDAEARVMAGITDWTGCSSCPACTAYRTPRTGLGFEFQAVQTRCTFAAVPGQNYNVKIYFARRVLGSSGPFLQLGQIYESNIAADEATESTDWVDVPSETGWETGVYRCEVTSF